MTGYFVLQFLFATDLYVHVVYYIFMYNSTTFLNFPSLPQSSEEYYGSWPESWRWMIWEVQMKVWENTWGNWSSLLGKVRTHSHTPLIHMSMMCIVPSDCAVWIGCTQVGLQGCILYWVCTKSLPLSFTQVPSNCFYPFTPDRPNTACKSLSSQSDSIIYSSRHPLGQWQDRSAS